MANVNIRAYKRRSRKGKIVKVKSYSRLIGKKGKRKQIPTIAEEKKEATKVVPTVPEKGSEFLERKKRVSPEILDKVRQWDSAARASTMSDYGKPVKATPKKVTPTTVKKTRKGGFFERAEDKLANFVETYGKRKYKKYG